MKILYVGYSRTGFTERALQLLKEKMGTPCRYVPIRTASRIGFLKAISHSMRKKPAKIDLISPPPNLAEYDLVVLGTPVWAGRISSPLRAFLRQYTGAKKVAVLATQMGGQTPGELFDEIDRLTGVTHAAGVVICSAKGDELDAGVSEFARQIKDIL